MNFSVRNLTCASFFVPALLLLSACGNKVEEPDQGPEEDAPIVAPLATVGHSSVFLCQGDMNITAIYGTDAKGQPDLSLIIDGDTYMFVPSDAPHGKRYTTRDGEKPGMGVVWWEENEDSALLQEAPLDQLDNPAAAKTLRTCKHKS